MPTTQPTRTRIHPSSPEGQRPSDAVMTTQASAPDTQAIVRLFVLCGLFIALLLSIGLSRFTTPLLNVVLSLLGTAAAVIATLRLAYLLRSTIGH